jgi:hypothetical protein
LSFVFEYDNVVIGSSLKAVLFAFNNRFPLIHADEQRPFRFDYLESNLDLSSIKLENQETVLKAFKGDKVIGVSKEILWERLLFFLSLDGKNPFSNLCKNMRLGDNTIVCSNEYSKIAEINFNTCYYFGDPKCFGLREKVVAKQNYICYDWIAFNRGGKHDVDYIKLEDNFVNEVWFYSSDRIDGNTPVKDACVVSRIKEEDILDFDFSETMARFKLISEMETRGMKGVFNGYGPNGKPKYYKFRTTSIARTKRKEKDPSWEGQDSIKMPELKEEDLLRDLHPASLAYDRFLRYF